MRVDGLEERVPACDNMTSKGTTEWALLDVSEQAGEFGHGVAEPGCRVQYHYRLRLNNIHIGASGLCGFISTAGTLVSWGFRDAEADAENEPAEDREAVNN